MTTLHGNTTLQEAIRRAKADPQALSAEQLSARHAQSVKEAEEECGPHVPSLILHLLPKKGRPKAGEIVEPVKAKSIKMSPALWDKIGALASKHGLSVHAFIKTVLLDFIEKDERRHAKS
jgi:hypothetical protein